MNEEKVLRILGSVDAVIKDSHIVYTSNRHGTAYVNKDAVYPYTQLTSRLCEAIASRFGSSDVHTVIAPAVGGVILSQWTAHHLSRISGCEILGVYADKEGEEFVIKRGYDKFIQGKDVLVVEDVLNTGGSVSKVVKAVRAAGGRVTGVGALCNRGGITPADIGDVPILFSLVNVTLDSWSAEDCPMCKSGVPVNTAVGKGKEFLKSKQT